MFKVIKKEGHARRGEFQCAHGGGRMLPDVVAMPFSGLGAADAGQDLRHSAA